MSGGSLGYLALRPKGEQRVDLVYARPESRARLVNRQGLIRLYLLAREESYRPGHGGWNGSAGIRSNAA